MRSGPILADRISRRRDHWYPGGARRPTIIAARSIRRCMASPISLNAGSWPLRSGGFDQLILELRREPAQLLNGQPRVCLQRIVDDAELTDLPESLHRAELVGHRNEVNDALHSVIKKRARGLCPNRSRPSSSSRAHPDWVESGCALDSLVGACPFRKTGSHFSGTCARLWIAFENVGCDTPQRRVARVN